MLYQLSRGGEVYGPYTRADLQRYVTSGNVLLTDLVKSEEMAEWRPVSEVLSPGEATAAPPLPYAGARGGQYAVPPTMPFPDPPNLPWGLALVLGVVTFGFFFVVWDLVLAAWLKRVQPNSRALTYYGVATVLVLWSMGLALAHRLAGYHGGSGPHPLANLVGLACWIMRLVARFTFRNSMEQHYNGPEPIGLRLSGVMTFFFGGLYFTYHVNRINRIKEGMRIHGAVR